MPTRQVADGDDGGHRVNAAQSPDETPAFDELARRVLARYALPDDVVMTLISRSENSVYCIEDPANGRRWVLRLHRRDYHALAAIASELAWLEAIARDTNVIVPRPVAGADGALIQTVPAGSQQQAAVLFHWEQGAGTRAAIQ
jgi:Ser/Thr protein kinase RdoA (MazF antagonist)